MARKNKLLIILLTTAATPALVQPSTAQEMTNGFGDFIGTVQIGESRRGVQTDTAAATTELSQEELDARQASTLAQYLNTVPGVTLVNGATPQGSAINIRGFGSVAGTYGADGKVSVVIDGVAKGQEEIYRNGGLLTIEPELFKRVNVTRGPGEGFKFSSGAIGGTVEATTKDASDFLKDGDTFAFRQKLGYESNGDGVLTTSILAWAPDAKLDVIAFFGYRDVGNRSDGDGTEQADSAFALPSTLVKAVYRFSDDLKMTTSYSYTENDEQDVSYDAYSSAATWATVDRYTKDTTAYLQFDYNPNQSDLINLSAKLAYSNEEIDLDSTSTSSDIYTADHVTERLAFSLENKATVAVGAVDHLVTTGVEIGRRTRTSISYTGDNSVSAPGGTDDYVAIYATDQLSFGNLTLTPQLRYEKQTLTSDGSNSTVAEGTTYKKDALVGALSARYAVNDHFAVFGTAAYNENLPVLDDLSNATYIEQSEKGRTFELGASYDTADVFAAGDALKAKLTGFKTDIWDVTTYSNTTTVDLEGLEFELSYVNPLFYVDFNASRIRGTVNGTDTDFNYAPADRAQLTLGKRFLDETLDLSVEATHAWANRRTSTTTTDSATSPSSAYTTYTLAASYTPKEGWADGMQFRAALENAFDETYRPYLSTVNASGRNLKLTISRTF
jgi:hemoglobin/transferrin/lactoferrin receptor protein